MSRLIFVASALALLCVTQNVWAQSEETQDLDLYSSGVDAAGTPLVQGAVDLHWEARDGQGAWKPAVYDKNNYCYSCGGIWLDHPTRANAISKPITHPDVRQQSAPNRTFSWRTTFSIPAGADPSTATITYFVGFDDASLDVLGQNSLSGCNHTVWLNGMPLSMTSSGNPLNTECKATIPKGAAFQTGTNTLEFRVKNISTYYGFRFEVESATYEGDIAPTLYVNLATPADGSLLANNTPEITGNTLSDPNTALTLTIEDEQGAIVETLTPTLDGSGRFALESSPLTDGSYALHAMSVNGMQMASAGPHLFEIDTTPPPLTIESPEAGAFLDTTTVSVEGTSEAGAKLTFALSDANDALLASSILNAGEDGSWVFAPTRELPAGTLSLVVIAADEVGNETILEHEFSIYLDKPSVSITAPARGMFLEDNTPTIEGEAIDSDEVEVLVDGVVLGIARVREEEQRWSFAVPSDRPLEPGAHTLEATVIDPWGNVFSSGIIPIAIAMPAPEEPPNNQAVAPIEDANNDVAAAANNTSAPAQPPIEEAEQDPTSMEHQVEDGCQAVHTKDAAPNPIWLIWMLVLGIARRPRRER
jgi:hypothetical protein